MFSLHFVHGVYDDFFVERDQLHALKINAFHLRSFYTDSESPLRHIPYYDTRWCSAEHEVDVEEWECLLSVASHFHQMFITEETKETFALAQHAYSQVSLFFLESYLLNGVVYGKVG